MLVITLGSSFFNGTCMACEVPARGVVVTTIYAGSAHRGAAPLGTTLVLCAEHHNKLRDELNKYDDRRDI